MCTGVFDTTSVTFTLKPIDANIVYTIERSFNIVITTFAKIASPSATNYMIDILIPTKKGTSIVLYGDIYDNIIYQTCIN